MFKFLKRIGKRSDYQEYLNSSHWKALRKKYLNEKVVCYVCHAKGRHVLHHAGYSNLGKEKIGRDLFKVCPTCHKKIHFWFFGLLKISLKRKPLLRSMYLRCFFSRMDQGEVTGACYFLLKTFLI